MAIGAELRQRILDLGLQQWLDAWERAGLEIPIGSRAFPAFSDPTQAPAVHPAALDRLFVGLQNAIVETMARGVECAWVNAIDQGETIAHEEDTDWAPAEVAIMNNLGVRLFPKSPVDPAGRRRWAMKRCILVQVPTADQAEYGAFDNRVDVKWTSESTEEGVVALNVRVVRVPSSGVIPANWSAPITVNAEYDGSKKVFETRFDEFGNFNVGDVLAVQIDRDADNLDDTLEADIGVLCARVV